MRIVFIDGMGGGLVAQVISQAAGRLPADNKSIGVLVKEAAEKIVEIASNKN